MTLSASQLVSTRSSNKKQRARTIEDYDEGISIITIGNPPGLHQQRNVLHHHLTAGYHGSHNFIQERDQGILFRRLLPSSKYVRVSDAKVAVRVAASRVENEREQERKRKRGRDGCVQERQHRWWKVPPIVALVLQTKPTPTCVQL
uniref:Uncharacterized protein n=1 Tax=Vespula pensylvanica TaxID=30213 RepID=A0A834PE11_VESPE|nr:hypothetical protein H0235_000358 [Vespula pensylvanica]